MHSIKTITISTASEQHAVMLNQKVPLNTFKKLTAQIKINVFVHKLSQVSEPQEVLSDSLPTAGSAAVPHSP